MPVFFLKRYFGELICAPIFAAHSGGLAHPDSYREASNKSLNGCSYKKGD